jgi:threonine/homoserine/homoserine lactone efflux protein
MSPNLVNHCVMSIDILLALMGFAFVTSVTPGPNNMMLLASGVNFGFRRTIPHMLGISIGHSVMVTLVGLGLAGLIHGWPPAMVMLKLASVAYMLWLAWKIAHAATPQGGVVTARPFGFLQAAAFQWVNPKAWAMALTASAAYAPEGSLRGVLIVAAVFAAVNLPSVSLWAWAGQAMRAWLSDPRRLVLFNRTMAVLLVVSLLPLLRI